MARRTPATPPAYSPPDHDARWRPRRRRGGRCGYSFDGKVCEKRATHYCEPRADHAVAFFAEVLVHTKGRFARHAFVLEPWQEHEIVRPIFGEVMWSVDAGRYVRRFVVAGIVEARKNGKSELAAGMVLYLLVGDGEESAEVYGAAKDTKQAGKVGDVVNRMRQLAPVLNGDHGGRLGFNKNARRIFDESTASYYEVITADAIGELGHNPHGFVLDEVLSQPSGDLWEALRTAAGTRDQPLFILATTETNLPESFGAKMIDDLERIAEDPRRDPRWFAYVRKMPRTDEELERLRTVYAGHPDLPVSTDVFDEANWRWPNPALDGFLSREALRQEATEASADPTKENAFRQFRMNQRVQQATRWMPMHLWDTEGNIQILDEDALKGRACYAGLDLASTTDLAAWVLLFPPELEGDPWHVLWRFWTPEAQLPRFDRALGGRATVWAKEGFLYVTEGDWIDYWGDEEHGMSSWSASDGVSRRSPAIHPQIEADHERYRIIKAGYDPKEATATAQHMQSLGIDVEPIYQGYSLSPGLKEIMRLVKAGLLAHGGHPVARWNADSAEVRINDEERLKLVKPRRAQVTEARVDGLAALATAFRVAIEFVDEGPTLLEGSLMA